MCQPNRPIVIGVTGGIGAGKSVVCRVCALRGIPLYDCDSRARRIMEISGEIRSALRHLAGKEAIMPDGSVNRPLLASVIFNDPVLRREVNTLVHKAVRTDIEAWIDQMRAPVAIIESAILHSSGLDNMVDEIWLVSAPPELRTARAAALSNLSEEQISCRISAQQGEFDNLDSSRLHIILNDGMTPLLPRIDNLLHTLINHNNNA